MTLSRKVILLVISTFIALVSILAVTSDVILLKSFAKLEKKVLSESVNKIGRLIDSELDSLEGSLDHYGMLFLEQGVGTIERMDSTSLVTRQIDFVACFGKKGELLLLRALDFHHRLPLELGPDDVNRLRQASNLAFASSRMQVRGFIRTDHGIAQLAMHRFSDNMILAGRFMDSKAIARISELTGYDIELKPADAEDLPVDYAKALRELGAGSTMHVAVQEEKRIAGYVMRPDIYGNPAYLLKLTEGRQLFEQGKASITYILLALCLSGAIFCGVILFFMRWTILERLTLLGVNVKGITMNGDTSARLELKGEEDELEGLAVSINSMLDSLEASRQALKTEKERYRLLFERAPDAILIIGLDGEEAGRIVAANRAAAEQHDYTVKELCSMRIYDINTPETNAFAGELIESIASGEWVTRELWHRKKDGTHFPVEVHAGLVTFSGRRYILGFDRDITARKKMEEADRLHMEQSRVLNRELARKASDLEAANRELEAFNYSVSHDMRGPLTRISGYCQLMLEDEESLNPESRQYLDRIYEASYWLDQMIDAMMALSRLSRTEFVPERVDLSLLVEDAIQELAAADPCRTVERRLQSGIAVEGDFKLLKILVTNLINNAWKYTADTENARIEFGVIKDTDAPVYFVRDNGAGFDMKDADRLFRAFSRLHDPTRFTGSGIGLATVQRIISRHGGRIWAEGEPGKGAAFFFTLGRDVNPDQS